MSRAKIEIYKAAQRAGLYRAARHLTRERLRILAYHGFALHDEADFRSKLFIRPATFRRRLETIRRSGFNVVSLGEAVAQLRRGRIQPDSVVITIDDGYATTLSVAAPILREYKAPATVYLTTYYMRKQTPVFDLMIAYIVWRSKLSAAVIRDLQDRGEWRLDLSSAAARDKTVLELVQAGRLLGSEAERTTFCKQVAVAVGCDYDAVASAGSFRLLAFDEARRLDGYGVSIGLHTHRHRFPIDDLAVCTTEVEENRALVKAEMGIEPEHFCYPSGVYSPAQWPLLRSLGISSATTCDTGLAAAGDSPLSLKRFLDGEMVSDIEFEAELFGFADVLRRSLCNHPVNSR